MEGASGTERGQGPFGEVSLPQRPSHKGGRGIYPRCPRRVPGLNSLNAERRGKMTCVRVGVRTVVAPVERGGDTSARCPYRTGLRTSVVGASRRDARAACSGAIRRTRKGVARGLVFDW